MTNLRTLRLVLAAALVPFGVGGVSASETEKRGAGKILLIGVGVTKNGWFKLRPKSQFEDLLNEAKCNRCTALNHISVRRFADGDTYVLKVSNQSPSKSNDPERYEPKEGDMVHVPCRLFDERDHAIPMTVSGPFYVISKEKELNANKAEEKADPKEEPASAEK